MSYMLRPKEIKIDPKSKVPNLYVGLTFIDLKPNHKQFEELKKINRGQIT